MAEGGTGLEPTIEISGGDYPEIMRILASGGDVDAYLDDVGVPADAFADASGTESGTCADEHAAFGGSLQYVVEAAGEAVAGPLPTDDPIIVPVSAATSLMATLTSVSNEGLRLAECLEGKRPEAGTTFRETFELLGLDVDRLKRAIAEAPTGG